MTWPFENDTSAITRKLAKRNLKADKSRNILIIITIALAACLIMTTTLYFFASQRKSLNDAAGRYQAIINEVDNDTITKLANDDRVQMGVSHLFGLVSYGDYKLTVRSMDETLMKLAKYPDLEGELPKSTNEIAITKAFLDRAGLSKSIGDTISLNLGDGEKDYTLCGILPVEKSNYSVFVSQSYVEKTISEPTYSAYIRLNESDGWSKAAIQAELSTLCRELEIEPRALQFSTYYFSLVEQRSSQYIAVITFISLIVALACTLVIYSLFYVSIARKTNEYGKLRTIGATGKQMKKIVLTQSLLLSAVGIPIGLLLGYGTGVLLAPVVIRTVSDNNSIYYAFASANPAIFIGAALFSIVTVLISCRKPSKMAGKVSPVEALRYTESNPLSHKKKTKKVSKKGISIFSMAYANMGRNHKKTFITVLSMSMSIVLFILTVTLSNGFSMEKYLKMKISTDFIVADASYFNLRMHWADKIPVSDDIIKLIQNMDGVTGAGKTYGEADFYDFISEDYIRNGHMSNYYSSEIMEELVSSMPKEGDQLLNNIDIYGMDDFCLDKLKVWEGDISRLKTEEDVVAAVYFEDDYGNIEEHTNWAKVGDTVKIRYAKEVEYYDAKTGEIYENNDLENLSATASLSMRPKDKGSKDMEYEVAAIVSIPISLNYRFYRNEQFILSSEQFIKDTGTSVPMYYTFDMVDDEAVKENMENFIADYTENVDPTLNYESRYTYAGEFESFRNMFMMMGSILSLIVGLIGILNFLNAVLTGIIARHREFAMLQSIGMTGKQLKKMLVLEGLCYTVGSVVISFILAVITSPLVANVIESMFWFFEYHFIITPLFIMIPVFVLLGILLPLTSYHFLARKSIVERLREAE